MISLKVTLFKIKLKNFKRTISEERKIKKLKKHEFVYTPEKALNPPSTGITVPVTNFDASDAR